MLSSGCSSQLALMSENGPCKVTSDGQSTENNPFSWNSNANIMWIDQPAQVTIILNYFLFHIRGLYRLASRTELN